MDTLVGVLGKPRNPKRFFRDSRIGFFGVSVGLLLGGVLVMDSGPICLGHMELMEL